MSKRTPNQPLCVQFAYLDLNDEKDAKDFVENIKEYAKMNIDFPIEKKWQEQILNVLDAWHLGEIKTRGLDKWIQKKRPQNKFVCEVLEVAKKLAGTL